MVQAVKMFWRLPAKNKSNSAVRNRNGRRVDRSSNGSIFAATENLPGWADFKLRAFAEERFACLHSW